MKRNENGFTIIEVVLVLAIAGLIFLAVFIALPALQKGQRDTQRRSDASEFMSQLQHYATNNNGRVPSSSAALGTFVANYLRKGATAADTMFLDPKNGTDYNVQWVTAANANAPEIGRINYVYQGKCNGETATTGGTNRQAAIVVGLEGAGNYCKDMGV